MAPPKRPWFRFYVEALTDPKLRRLSAEERWLWVVALGLARQSPVPGWLLVTETIPMEPDDMSEMAGVTSAKVGKGLAKMVDLGLLIHDKGGAYRVAKWAERQFESDDVTKRTGKHRSKNGDTDTMERSFVDDGTPSEAEADTETENNTSAVAAVADRPEVLDLCEHLADLIEANGSKRPTIGKGWLDACRLMIDRDGRSPEQIRRAIDWCQGNEFWRANVLSMPKLREQYDTLRLQAQRTPAQDRGERQAESYRNLREQMAALDEADARAAGRAIGAGE